MIHPRTLKALEFERITARLADCCLSAQGRRRALALGPMPDRDAVDAAVRLHEEAALCFSTPCADGRNFSLLPFPDVQVMLDAAEGGNVRTCPDAETFWALREVLRQAMGARCAIDRPEAAAQWPGLLALADAPLPKQLAAALIRCISDDALIRDESSPELHRLRGELRRLHQDCLHKVKEFAQRYNIGHYLQDEFMTLASDRYVLPLKADFKGRLQGIIHDWSQTGETCYFEPMFLLEINNRLQELKHEEREEELRILRYLFDLFLAALPEVRNALTLLTELDLLQAKRRLAGDFGEGYCLPLTNEGIGLFAARHPLLALAARSGEGEREARPLDIELRPGDRALVITGANAGGKTVCLKTLGLIVAMCQSAIPVPVGRGSRLPWFSRMDAFIGDEQSLEDSVSTFTAQVRHLGRAWDHLDRDGLVLLDEFGAGTDPAQGAALAQAVLEALGEKGTTAVAATHFPSLKTYALTTEGVRAASMLFDTRTRRPMFVLAYDQVGASRALDVAKEHGLPETILVRAQKLLLQDGEDATPVLDRLNDLAVRRESELAGLQAQRRQFEERRATLEGRMERERAALAGDVREKAQEILRAYQEGRAGRRQALKELGRMRAELEGSRTAEAEEAIPVAIVPGMKVRHAGLKRQGVVTEVDVRRGRLRLDLGGVSLWAGMAEVAPVADEDRPAPARGVTTSGIPVPLRLDVRGLDAESALAELDVFLDRTLLRGSSEVEVVHGRGTGVLRRRIHEALRAMRAVESFVLAPEDRGGDGMTIVSLR
ncbi:MAG: Smr/MutS family protein [Desulfovibrio sp.]|jgi:DNA mismatch repair protein MutS2|nr:Smr/MutS family protein [Desulfovibrio sp.]